MALRRAVDMYDGDLLPGLDEIGEPAISDWVLSLRSECYSLFMRAGAAFLATAAEEIDTADRIALALRLLRVDPCAEMVHQSLIRTYLESGQYGAARDQFEHCRAILDTELGIEPGPETRRLIQFVDKSSDENVQSIPSGNDHNETSPSLVVLPIDNLAGDPALTYLVNGLTDDITTELTRYRSLFVISRDSAFASHIRQETNAVVCRRFGVRHALRGSLRRIRHGFRINLRLIDGDSGQNVWGESYEVSAEELIALPLDVVNKVAGCIAAWLERDVLARTRYTKDQ